MRGAGGNIDDECRGDLVARERRGELSGPDCLALRAHLAQCASCRLARQVFVDLDHVSGVDLRDGARIERMSTAARRWSDRRSRPVARRWRENRHWRTFAVAASVLLVGGTTASATVWWWRHPASGVSLSLDPPEGAGGGRVHIQRNRHVRARPSSTALVTPPSESPESVQGDSASAVTPQPDPVEMSSSHVLRRRSVHATRPAVEGSAARPALLLRQASDARHAGDADRAAGIYRKLQQEFPDSSEAILSEVSLGGLLLDRRSPRAALGQFDGYLKASPNGVLTPEALYGRGRALAALGDRAEERRTWERLLSNFSDSAYGPLARRRLADLK
jgi:TolA-binding protein